MRRASTTTGQTNLKDFGTYGYVESKRNLKDFSDPERGMPQKAPAEGKRGSIFSVFKFDFNDELESTKQDIEAKEHAMKSAPIDAVHEHKMAVVEQVVNDEEQWKKFRDQMRKGGAKTGMQLKHNLDELLEDRAQELETSGAAVQPVRRNRRASLTDFASSLMRGEDSRQAARRTTNFTNNKLSTTPESRKPSSRSGHDSYQESIGNLGVHLGKELEESHQNLALHD